MAPALVVLGIGVEPTRALVFSQVVLSFGIPFALVPLVLLTRRPDVMGSFRNAGATTALASVVALLASGLSSSSVGTYAGQVVMQGFIARTIPLVLRRLITMTPALIVLAIGVNPSRSLVISQVVLSFGIPFALVPLVLLTRRKDIMGALVNRRLTTVVASIVAALIIALNLFLIVDTIFG